MANNIIITEYWLSESKQWATLSVEKKNSFRCDLRKAIFQLRSYDFILPLLLLCGWTKLNQKQLNYCQLAKQQTIQFTIVMKNNTKTRDTEGKQFYCCCKKTIVEDEWRGGE